MRRPLTTLRFPLLAVTCLATAACGEPRGVPAEAAASDAAPAASERWAHRGGAVAAGAQIAADPAGYGWVDPRGTSIVGFGILRLVPAPGAASSFRIRYREVPDGYATTGNLQLFVLPGDAFATKDRAYAGEFLAFARTEDEAATDQSGALRLETTVTASRETTVLVAYGPWTAPDAGRPAGDVPTFSLDVDSESGEFEWIESEAGELITTNWTNRPEVQRGSPAWDPLRPGARVHLEVRPMILYDGRLVRASDEPAACDLTTAKALRDEADALAREGRTDLAADRRERADDLESCALRAERRLVLTPALAERFRRVPIRWR